jgi:tetratricopeptide (TPR) repeat protein
VPSIAEVCDELPDELDPVFRRALAKNPSDRFSTAAEFVAAIRDALQDAAGETRPFQPLPVPTPTTPAPLPPRAAPPPRRRNAAWAALGALLLAGGLAGAIAAAVLSGGDDKGTQGSTVVRTVTQQGTTVRTTVTSPSTSAPPPSPPPPPPPAGGNLSLSQARNLVDQSTFKMRDGDFAGSLPLAQRALRALTGSGDIYEAYANYNVGYSLLQLDRCDEAMGFLKTAQKLEPERSEPKDALERARECAKGKN